MEITQLTTPPDQTPQLRYATLHRTIERGIVSSSTWAELVQVCLQLRYIEEARRALDNVSDPERRVYFERLLARIDGTDVPPLPTAAADPHSARPASAAHAAHAAHPRRGHARHLHGGTMTKPSNGAGQDRPLLREPFSEEILDSFRYLFLEHMPLTVIVATMTFPLVLGLGGFLTAGSPFFLFPAIALLPGLCVLGLVGALGRRILLDASKGIDDPPRVPELGVLAREGAGTLRDFAALAAVFLGPGALLVLLDAPTAPKLLTLLLGGALLPTAMLLRQMTPDWRALSPNFLFPAFVRGGVEHLAATGVIVGLFVPATIAAFATLGSHMYLQVSVIGPLSVAPLFIAARLLGRVVDRNREQLAPLFGELTEPQPPAPEPPSGGQRGAAVSRQQASRAAEEHLLSLRQRLLKAEWNGAENASQSRPTAQRATPAAAAHPTLAASQRAHPEASTQNRAAAAPQPRAQSRRPANPTSQPGAAPQPQQQQRAKPAAAKSAAAKSLRARPNLPPVPGAPGVIGDPIQDLTKLPGVCTVTGSDREAVGAASGCRPRNQLRFRFKH